MSGSQQAPEIFLSFGREVRVPAFAKGLSARPNHQFMLDSTGACPWWGGVLLASWISHEPPNFFSKDHVIELGCGSAAMPSAAASQRGAKSTLATDGCPINAHAAGQVLESSAASEKCTWRCLAWQDCLDEADRGSWDFVLFADVLYKEEGASMLVSAISSLLRPGGTVIGAVGLHRVGSKKIFEAMQEQGFKAHDVPVNDEVMQDALNACGLLRGSQGTMDSTSISNNECRLVRWVRHESSPDMADAIYQEFLHPARQVDDRADEWVPTE